MMERGQNWYLVLNMIKMQVERKKSNREVSVKKANPIPDVNRPK